MHKPGLLLWLLLLPSCDSSGTAAGHPNETFIQISPTEFDVPCGGAEATELPIWSSYVVTLIEVKAELDKDEVRTAIRTAPPAPCNAAVRFAFDEVALTGGHRYAAEVLGFSERGLEPAPGDATGFLADGGSVDPSWRGSCGSGLPPGNGQADAGSSNDSFFDSFWGPQAPVRGRTVTLQGCRLEPITAPIAAEPPAPEPTDAGPNEAGPTE